MGPLFIQQYRRRVCLNYGRTSIFVCGLGFTFNSGTTEIENLSVATNK